MSQETSVKKIARTGKVDSDGYEIHFSVAGQGLPMVLVHGWGADASSNWEVTGWIDALTKYRQVISIDVRGHGRSDKPHALEPYSYAAMCQDVLAVMDAMGVERVDYLGYSMGAFMGAYLLGHHPLRFRSMVLGGIGDETEKSSAQGEVIAQALRATAADDVQDPVGAHVRAFVEANPNNDPEALAYSAQQMWPEGYPLRVGGPDIATADVPVLIVNGENDHPYVDSADQLADALLHGRYVTIPGQDHLSVVADVRFKQAVIAFLTQS